MTSFRAQGLTTDTAYVLVASALTRETRETLCVAMTRGRDANVAYVAVDKPDASHDGPHPGENDEVTGRSVLAGVLQHASAELSAHETIAVEQEAWARLPSSLLNTKLLPRRRSATGGLLWCVRLVSMLSWLKRWLSRMRSVR